MNPTARTLPASKLEPNVIPLASFFFDDVAAPPVEPATGLLAVAAEMTLEQELAAPAGLTIDAAPPKLQAPAALDCPL